MIQFWSTGLLSFNTNAIAMINFMKAFNRILMCHNFSFLHAVLILNHDPLFRIFRNWRRHAAARRLARLHMVFIAELGLHFFQIMLESFNSFCCIFSYISLKIPDFFSDQSLLNVLKSRWIFSSVVSSASIATSSQLKLGNISKSRIYIALSE